MQGGNRQPKIIETPAILRYERTKYGKNIRKDYESGNINGKICNMRELQPRQDGISNTLTSVQKDNYIIEQNHTEIPCFYDDRDKGFGVKSSDVCPTQRANRSGIKCIESNYRIRKLTPKECWRLTGFEDSDIDKCIEVGISDTQLYKQAGNSIVVKVLEKLSKKLFGRS